MRDNMKILFIGDLVGQPGRALFKKVVPRLKEQYQFDALIVNGENCAHDGRGITPAIVDFLKRHGAHIVTSGNHIFAKKDIYPYLSSHRDLLRPINFPASCPGTGVATFTVAGVTVGVINVQGRIFMRELLGCPFKAAETAITFLQAQKVNCIIVDMHAEATSEKLGLAYYLDGKVSAVLGTHTHVPTADERILSGGTAFISDVGCCAAIDSMIGMKKGIIIQQLITQMPAKFEVEHTGPFQLNAVLLEIDPATGKALSIKRVTAVEDYLDLSDPELKDK